MTTTAINTTATLINSAELAETQAMCAHVGAPTAYAAMIANNNQAFATWARKKAAEAAEELVEVEEDSLTAPITNAQRCSSEVTAETWPKAGGFQRGLRIAFFDRRGQWLRTVRSSPCTYSDDSPSRKISPAQGECYARVEWYTTGNQSRSGVYLCRI